MKVLMVCTVDLEKNGISAWIKNYSKTLQKENCQVDILAAENVDVTSAKFLEESGCLVHALSNRKKNTLGYTSATTSIFSRRTTYAI